MARSVNVKIGDFEKQNVIAPDGWSDKAVGIAARIYMTNDEYSVFDMIDRVVRRIVEEGDKLNYFSSYDEKEYFRNNLRNILIDQKASFNTPVWCNVGVPDRDEQCFACVILGVEDNMESIAENWDNERKIFQGGSGSGVNISKIRADGEPLSDKSGFGSGPISLWMRPTDSIAGVVKSGGKTRRAAKMVVMDVDHPEIMDFIKLKENAENMARDLQRLGYDISMNGKDSPNIPFQNANNSVRVTDAFMKAVLEDGDWHTTYRTSGRIAGTYKARDIWRAIAKAAHSCGDPGIQFHDTTNRMNSCINDGEIVGSNPCVAGDTLVSTTNGLQRIDALLDSPFKVLGSDGFYHWINPAWLTGTKKVYLLKTKAGYSIKVTENHKVTTINGDIEAGRLTPADKIVLSSFDFGNETLDQRIAEFIGLALGDGYRSDNAIAITLSSEEREVAEYINSNLNSYKLEQIEAPSRSKRRTTVNQPQKTLRITAGSYLILDIADKYTILNQGSDKKEFTEEVFTLNKYSISSLLRGLFSSDGTVGNYSNKSQYISLDLTSKKLLEQVQLLLLGFGIKSKIYENRRKAGYALLPDGNGGFKEYPTKTMHSLRISRNSRVKFEKEIGFLAGSVKNTKLQEMNKDVTVYKDQMFDNFSSLEYIGEEKVYDLTEDVSHHFVGNGVVVSNCSEYLWLNDTVCNLSSINLMKFYKNREIDTASLYETVCTMITAMDILVDLSSYPSEKIANTSKKYRNLGLGYTNLGALLMSHGVPYNSEEGRDIAASITSYIQAASIIQSQTLARRLGAYPAYDNNKEPQTFVVLKHRSSTLELRGHDILPYDETRNIWSTIIASDPLRNAQLTLLAPTGTISFLMDCETTGIEPVLAMSATKTLVNGGKLAVGVSDCVKAGIESIRQKEYPRLMTDEQILEEYRWVFETALGDNSIHPSGHVEMMAAVQPFLSMGISKTVNMPEKSTIEDIENIYMEAWHLGIKSIAVYRDGSKSYQPVSQDNNTITTGQNTAIVSVPSVFNVTSTRRKPPGTRAGDTHKFNIGDAEFYLTMNYYDDGTPCEIFLKNNKHGSEIGGWVDAFAIAISAGLQYGIPIEWVINQFKRTNFLPSGFVESDSSIKMVDSPLDYVARWIEHKLARNAESAQRRPETVASGTTITGMSGVNSNTVTRSGAPKECPFCSSEDIRDTGTCFTCGSCGESIGGCA